MQELWISKFSFVRLIPMKCWMYWGINLRDSTVTKKVVYQKLLYFIYSNADVPYTLANISFPFFFFALQISIPFGLSYPKRAIISHLGDLSQPIEYLIYLV